ncbi:C-type lectin domain family 11 member A [Bufo gargarizans]|uniref:C-type lectin domain family 11 member A n=1 Tax=Bufo gargarizans TaxID=30331 RepID=UPI001CF3FAAD|nr:C-type lectin domain family 11 member A [Bufo gargarizans]
MIWTSIFLILFFSQLCKSQAEVNESAKRVDDETSEMENRLSAEEQNKDLEKVLLGHLEIIVPPEKHVLLPPKMGSKISFNVTLISGSQNGNGVIFQKPDEEDQQEEEAEETDEEASKEDKVLPTITAQPATTLPTDDNLSYILSRLSGIEAAIHRLNVQFYGLDVKVTQMSQSVSKMRTKLDEAEDTIATVSEINARNQRQIGHIEGCLKGKRYFRKCYLIFQHFENYATAQQLCHSRGGNLAMPIDQNEFAALAQYVHDAFFPFNWPIWIGINDLRSEGMYQFENGHRVSYFNWYKDHLVTQPNGGILENCVSISSDDGKWWDNDCSRRMYYICEY